jgi:hypothetical protein
MEDETEQPSESLLPYETWTEEALRHVMVRALQHVAAQGLPGGHHFYLTFRTDYPGVDIPAWLTAKYPEEMTIVLQHQFWDLAVDEAAGRLSVGLSFGGVPTTLVIPLGAICAFADPFVRHGMRFNVVPPDRTAAQEGDAPEGAAPGEAGSGGAAPAEPPAEAPQVVSLDAFRHRTPPKT